MDIKPFKALRPKVELAKEVASPPYDVLNSAEARIAVAGLPLSFLHVTKSEVDLPENIDTHNAAVYEKAAENLQQFIASGTLFQEATPCYYIYELEMHGRKQTGLVCGSSVADYHNNKILKHEYTRPEKEQDRIDHMHTIKAQTGNVFLAYNDVPEMNSLVANIKEAGATYDFVAEDGIAHKIWVVQDAEAIAKISYLFTNKVPVTYIADGHHRAASAAKVSNQMPESKEAKYFLTTIFPASELKILDYNRVVKDLNGLTANEFLEKISNEFVVVKSNVAVKPTALHHFGMYLENAWYTLTAKDGTYDPQDVIGVLDVQILEKNILNKFLGIQDVRTDKRIDFVGGIRGLEALEKRVNSGEMSLAFSLYPVTIQQLFNVSDSGRVMPPKSTWFEPKLRDGLLTHLI
jgi:uncharacterized protein (DUF1015 family)